MAISRRQLLLGLTGGVVAGALLRPADQSAPYSDYFRRLNLALAKQGPGRPLLVIDRARLLANCDTLMGLLPAGRQLRLVAKSLPSVALLETVMARTGSQRLMLFHQPFLSAVAQQLPHSDVLLGKPLPVQAARTFYQNLDAQGSFDPQQQLQWLIDSLPRLQQYLALGKALNQRLNINIEIDVGLRRGGLGDPEQLDALLTLIHQHPEQLRFSGFMGYDGQVGKLPGLVESGERSYQRAQQTYQAFIDRLYQLAPDYRQQALTFNGAGSGSLAFHDDHTVLNELAVGACLLKPGDFVLPGLADFQSAAFIAAPVLKQLDGLQLPGPLPLGPLWALWDRNRRQSWFIYGGHWLADPHAPSGIRANPLYGASSNQMMFNGGQASNLKVGDQLFLLPRQSEAVLLQFGDLAVWDGQAISEWWEVIKQ